MQPDLCGYCPELVQWVTSRTHTAWRSTAFGRFPALLRPLPSFLQPAGQRFLSNCCFIIFFNLLWAKKAEKDACSDRAQCKNEQAPQKEGVAILDATWSKPKQLLCFPGWLFLQGPEVLATPPSAVNTDRPLAVLLCPVDPFDLFPFLETDEAPVVAF